MKVVLIYVYKILKVLARTMDYSQRPVFCADELDILFPF